MDGWDVIAPFRAKNGMGSSADEVGTVVEADPQQMTGSTSEDPRYRPCDGGFRCMVVSRNPITDSDGFDGPPIDGGSGGKTLIDDQEIQRRDRGQVSAPGERLHHREHCPTRPRLLVGIEHRRGESGIDAGKLGAVLPGEFVAVGQDAGFRIGIAQHAAGQCRQHDGLTSPGHRRTQCVAMLAQRREAALDEDLLAFAEDHDNPL